MSLLSLLGSTKMKNWILSESKKVGVMWTKYFLFLVTILLFNQPLMSQDILILPDGTECGLEGSAKRKNDKTFNRLKNRYSMPQIPDLEPNFSWKTILDTFDDRRKFNARRAAILRGYVVAVKMSNPESCNCNSNDPEYRDTHIVLSPDKASSDDKNRHLVAEVTPRIRLLMKQKGVDWSQNALKKLKGKTIEVEGWLFYDYNHGDKSANIRPQSNKTLRATAWEIHPIIRITLPK